MNPLSSPSSSNPAERVNASMQGGDYRDVPQSSDAGDSIPTQRKRIVLEPRSQTKNGVPAASNNSGKSPFGAARPREEVLASKGIDAKIVDDRIQKKAAVVHFSREQEAQVEAMRAELTQAEEDWREANENELPEEKYRLLVETKKKELSALMAKFTEANLHESKEPPQDGSTTRHRFERPSERRQRTDNPPHHRPRKTTGLEHEEAVGMYSSFGRRSEEGRKR